MTENKNMAEGTEAKKEEPIAISFKGEEISLNLEQLKELAVKGMEYKAITDEKPTEGDIEEIKRYFPKIKDENDLPDEVLAKCKLSGSKLLDEYLRYLLSEKRAVEKAAEQAENTNKKSLGSLQNKNIGNDPEAAEFIKGLWK